MMKVLCCIPTRDRYQSLAMALQSVVCQTQTPDGILIVDDGEKRDLREDPIFHHLFRTMDAKGIRWVVEPGMGLGQHYAHQRANQDKEYDLVWRLDDDCVAESNVLENLYWLFGENEDLKIGAVAGSVITPNNEMDGGTNLLKDIFTTPNKQWSRNGEITSVEHLYSSFLYRSGIADYELSLSPVAHREETIFSMRIAREGYDLLVDPSIVTWHYRYPSGGIRTPGIHKMEAFAHDEKIFRKELELSGYKMVTLNGGLGDHFAFLKIVPELIDKHKNLIIGCCHPDVFQDIPEVTVVPYGAIKNIASEDVYKYMADKNWTGHIVDAYRSLYL